MKQQIKPEDLKFPMIVRWASLGNTYAVEDNGGKLDYTKVGETHGFYPDSTGRDTLAHLINHGTVTVLAQPTNNEPVTLAIKVDSTQAVAKLEAATKAAKELQEALTTVKGMLV